MAKRKSSQLRKEAMYADFYKLRDTKEDGIPLYTFAVIINRLHKKYFWEPRTIEQYLSDHFKRPSISTEVKKAKKK